MVNKTEKLTSIVNDVEIVETFNTREFLLNAQIGDKLTSHQTGSPVTRVIVSKRWNRSTNDPNECAIEILTD
jgi:hypothetical protein